MNINDFFYLIEAKETVDLGFDEVYILKKKEKGGGGQPPPGQPPQKQKETNEIEVDDGEDENESGDGGESSEGGEKNQEQDTRIKPGQIFQDKDTGNYVRVTNVGDDGIEVEDLSTDDVEKLKKDGYQISAANAKNKTQSNKNDILSSPDEFRHLKRGKF